MNNKKTLTHNVYTKFLVDINPSNPKVSATKATIRAC